MSTEKEERFHKIAEARTNRVIDDLRLLSNCANKNNYSYTKEEVSQMIKAIDDAVRSLKAAFESKDNDGKSFTFRR